MILLLGSLIPSHASNYKAIDAIEALSNANKEMVCLAKVIYDEARGETPRGMQAVAHVVLNRAKHQDYPGTICGVAYQKHRGVCQFSGMCKKKTKQFDAESLNVAYRVLVLKDVKDPTRGATHFHNDTTSPPWSKTYVRTARIGKHTFYKPGYRQNPSSRGD